MQLQRKRRESLALTGNLDVPAHCLKIDMKLLFGIKVQFKKAEIVSPIGRDSLFTIATTLYWTGVPQEVIKQLLSLPNPSKSK